jgi:type II secretory pathway pseudopilin PulG
MKDHTATKRTQSPATRAPRERGYALIALLALMTVMMFAAMALAPSVRHQSVRELETEAIARGEQVAEAIRAFTHIAKRLPTSMEELQEGAPFGTKKIQVLRASSARDPLSKSGEWRLIKAQDREFIEFIRALVLYTNGKQPQQMTTDSTMRTAVPNIPTAMNILDLGDDEDAPGGEITTATSNGPFVGVASRSQRESVIAYYGIERHDKWIFTPLFK